MTNSIAPMGGNCNLPAAFAGLNDYPQFILYRREWDAAKGKWGKLPTSPKTGWKCGATDSSEWMSYEDAYAACLRFGADGVGFCFSESDPFWFLDIDHCLVNGAWSARAIELSSQLSGAAIEISGGGDGLHIIGTGARPDHSCRNTGEGLELYSHERFCALTFTSAAGNVLADKSAEISAIAARFFPPKEFAAGAGDWTTEPVPEWAGPDDDDALIKIARNARLSADSLLGGKATFSQLWDCDEDALGRTWPNEGGTMAYDGSAADLSLATRLAYYTGKNCERIERLMRASGLARDKWDARPEWLEDTIKLACANTTKVYNRPVKSNEPVLVVPPPPRPGHCQDDLGHRAFVMDKNNHLYVEAQVRGHCDSLQYDMFKDAILLNGEPMTDNTERRLWFDVCASTALNINKTFFAEVVRDMAFKNKFHPVRDYLDAAQVQWDGVERCEEWLIRSGGAEDTPFNRAISRIFLVAAARRVRVPGEKYDELLVLEGPQGLLKSSLLKALPPDQKWFSDTLTLGMDTKEVMETLRGVWIVEAPELSHMSKSEVDGVKAMLSRVNDRARPAYGRNVEDVYRQCIPAGTVNGENYLRDPTGNRRFWPVRLTRTVDIKWIESVRDQLWAEAAVRESAGESIRLDPSLYAAAEEQQALRMVDDPFSEVLAERLGDLTGRVDSSVVWAILGVPIERRHGAQAKMGEAMKRNGWERKQFRNGDQRRTKYWRGSWENEITLDTIQAAALGEPPATVTPMERKA